MLHKNRLAVISLFTVFIWYLGSMGCEAAPQEISDNTGGGDADADSDGDADGDDDDGESDDDDDDNDDNDDNDNDDNDDNNDDNDDNDNDDDDGDTDDETDADNDGFTDNEGDCDDGEPLVNPDAIEDLGETGQGDNVDNDCDGLTDEIEEPCDAAPVGTEAEDLAKAMNLCDPRFVKDVQRFFTTDKGGEVAFDTVPKQGDNTCLVARHGEEMAALSTGPVGQVNPNDATPISISFQAETQNDPMPEYQGDEMSTASVQPSCDVAQLRLSLKAPSNAVGFSFDFVFGSSEYDEWINKSFNDTFYAILEYSELNSGKTTNISFDSNGNEIEVDVNFFENTQFPCDETGSGWEPAVHYKSGSTGWLRTTRSLEQPGEEFVLTFSIHDEGDCIFDSITFIDNFLWWTTPVEDDTIIIE